ncbi:MAG: hypothetical protein LQ338_005131 [Usnochroma carphineum]|nr:MAG: hypothetical protein LQ338_005131 [Usnochroma carphineum]
MAKTSHHQKTPKADPRFANIQTDPRFRLPSKKHTHVQIDKRFERMLVDESFSSRAKVDRYGRKLPKDAGKKELERYYRIQEDQKLPTEDREVKRKLERANANCGEEDISSSAEESSSEEESGLDVSEEEEVFALLDGQEADGEGVPLGEVTSRLAVVNLDWDNIRAADLMAVFSSFVSSAGQIKKISVYPSDFGRERIEREEMEGPPKEIFAKDNGDVDSTRSDLETEDQDDGVASGEEDDEQIKRSLLQEGNDQDFNSAKLRRYQLERLRYYYAVLICSSPSVAQNIYEAVDGTEYLTTANFFDLRFIPDDVEFSHDIPRDECTRIPDGYRPNEFVTDALQHSKVRLTWDADDGKRKDAQKRAFAGSRTDIHENDLKAYLGSDTSDDEDDAPEPIVVDATATTTAPEPEQSDNPPSQPTPKPSKKEAERQRMRALLGLEAAPATTDKTKNPKSDRSAPVGDMQITFSSGLTSSTSQPNTNSVFTNSPGDANHEETTVEKYVRKEKERKARRKEKLRALREADNNNETAPEASPNKPTGPEAAATNAAISLENEKEKETEDLGFSDPFFADPDSAPAHKSAAAAADRKSAKRLQNSQRAAEAAVSAAQRAELELLTMPDDGIEAAAADQGTTNFNIHDILKAEKALARSQKSGGKKKKARQREKEKEAKELVEKDGFRVDVQDPRFGAVFQRPEFAIDPSHPRFLGTGGMREFLEEGRRKRGRGEEEGEDGGERKVRREEKGDGERDGDGGDVERLVERVKSKVKK